MSKEIEKIPVGPYCYSIKKIKGDKIKICACPYWELRKDKPTQDNGYCHYLERGDWEDAGTSLLWDMVKECGINSEPSSLLGIKNE